MSDHYQAIFDAAFAQFDISWAKARLEEQFMIAAHEMARPSTVYKPAIYPDGNKWCALYGANLQEGVAGFGDSPADAFADFDKAWIAKLPIKHQAA